MNFVLSNTYLWLHLHNHCNAANIPYYQQFIVFFSAECGMGQMVRTPLLRIKSASYLPMAYFLNNLCWLVWMYNYHSAYQSSATSKPIALQKDKCNVFTFECETLKAGFMKNQGELWLLEACRRDEQRVWRKDGLFAE